MNKLFLLTIAAVFVALAACKHNKMPCQVDEKLQAEFENCMTFARTIAIGQYGFGGFDLEQQFKLIRSLEVLTKYRSKIELDHGIAWYKNLSDFRQDSVAWQKWFEENKCGLTIDMVADTFAMYQAPFPDYSNPTVLEEIKRMYPIEMQHSVRVIDSLMHIKYRLDWPDKLN